MKLKERLFWIGVGCLLIGAGLFISTINDLNAIKKAESAPTLTQTNIGTISTGDVFKIELQLILDYYAEEYTTNYGVKTGSSSYYYVFPVSENGTTEKYLSIKSIDFATYDKMTDEAYNYYTNDTPPTTTKTITVRVKKLSKEIRGYLNDWFTKTQFLGAGVTNYDAYILPYYINDIGAIDSKTSGLITGGVIFLIGLMIVLPFMIGFLSARKNKIAIKADDDTSEHDSFDESELK